MVPLTGCHVGKLPGVHLSEERVSGNPCSHLVSSDVDMVGYKVSPGPKPNQSL